MGFNAKQRRIKISFLYSKKLLRINFYFTVIDIYQEWAGATIVLEDIFIKLKRNLIQAEYLTFYSANCENIELLKPYRGYCEPLLLFYGVILF
jgi:hypothetical protein